MKYKIDGIEKSRIIKNIKVVDNKFIEVKYLNGKKDVIEYSGNNFNKIKDIMTEQAKKYVDNYEGWLLLFGDIMTYTSVVTAIAVAIVGAILSLVCCLMAIINSGVITTSVCGILSILFAKVSLKKIKEVKYFGKYNLYLKDDFKQELDKYKDVMNKEKSLGKKLSKKEQKQVALTDITVLDNYSLEELKNIREKVSRYTSLVGDNIEVPVIEEVKGKQKVKK